MVFIDPPYDLCFADNLNFTLCGTSDLLHRFRSGESKTHQTLQAEPVEPGCSRSNNIGQKAVWPFGSSGLFTWTLMGAYHPVRTRRGGITGQLWHGCTLGPPGTPCVMTIDPGDSTEGLVELRIDGFGWVSDLMFSSGLTD